MAELLRRQLLGLSGLSLAMPGWTQTQPVHSALDLSVAAQLRDSALLDTHAYRLIEGLCTEVGARTAGSPQDALAVAWAQRELSALGLATSIEPVNVTPWLRGEAKATLLAPHEMPIVITSLGNSVGTPSGGLIAEIVYYFDLAALRADTSERARGKIVFIDQKTERTKDGSGYGKAVLARIAGAGEAARRGAVGVAIRSIGTSNDRLAHTGAMRYEPQLAQLPAIAVSKPDADLVARLHARGLPMKLRLSMRNEHAPKTLSANVLGEIKGSDPQVGHEVVQLGAHLDSWDLGQGAIDDAAGVGIVTAAVAMITKMGLKPKRTIRVVLFANEENGFDGAITYAEAHKNEPHQMVSESDFGAGKVWRMASRVNPAALGAIDNLAAVLKPLGIEAGGNQGNPGPDAGVLMRARGWPALALSQDGTTYFDYHHTANDTLDKIDPATLPQNVAAWAVSAWLASQSAVSFGPTNTNPPRP